MIERIVLNKKTLENIEKPKGIRAKTIHDVQLKGLQVIVTDKGIISFYARKQLANGQAPRILLGHFPLMTVEQARKKALTVLSNISQGIDVKEEKNHERVLLFGELLQQYIDEYAKGHCVSWKEIAAVFRRYFSEWNLRELKSITNADVQRKINSIGQENGKTAANHAFTYGRAAINWCIKFELTKSTNPFLGVKKFRLPTRERFLRPEEMARFFRAIEKMDNANGFRDYVYISLFTGARRTNVLSMRWSEIDFVLCTWTIPRTKNGEFQIIPLTTACLTILHKRYDAKTSDWVFPGPGAKGHVVEPKKYWYALLDEAKIENLRLHDLRRTLGSYMAMGNQSLQMIGKVLGHKSASATQIYARFTNDPIRVALEKAQQDILLAAQTSS